MSLKFYKLGIALLCMVMFCACSSKNKDIVPDKKPEELYIEAYKALASERYNDARINLEAIDNRYPFGPYAHQVQLDLIYTYYKDRENELALAEIDKFIRLNPSDEHLDYVLYMRGLTNLQKATDRFLDFIHVDTYDRDTAFYEVAYKDFKKLYETFPHSLYAADAYARMVSIRSTLARHELDIIKFYHKKQAYISAARHCHKLLLKFHDSDEVKDALKILIDSYKHLNLHEAAANTQKLYDLNFN
ncbi:MAG: outer membrane protein assembly factor BamD [Ruminobacter sp.]|jgi:outer membrane protein assembly factor BamD|nr:outer membrane protein assembly factor BamD [Ruminobacter sp.]